MVFLYLLFFLATFEIMFFSVNNLNVEMLIWKFECFFKPCTLSYILYIPTYKLCGEVHFYTHIL